MTTDDENGSIRWETGGGMVRAKTLTQTQQSNRRTCGEAMVRRSTTRKIKTATRWQWRGGRWGEKSGSLTDDDDGGFTTVQGGRRATQAKKEVGHHIREGGNNVEGDMDGLERR